MLSHPGADLSGYEKTLERIQRTTGDELVRLIGPEATYELVEGLYRHGKTIASVAGGLGRIASSDGLRKRNLWILRMRLVEGRSAEEIGERAEVTASRVRQLLKEYFGIDKSRSPRGRIVIPLDALPLARQAVRRQLVALATQLQDSLLSDGESLPDRHNFDLSWALLDDLEAGGHVHLARSCGPRLIHAVRTEMERERAARKDMAPRTLPDDADEKATQLQGLLNTLLS
jgi:Sigma-70, region 4